MLRFGTDGVRGVANVELTPELALALGRAAARVLGGDRYAVGRDTRRSGPLLEAALAAGLASEGADVTVLGVAPTPEVAWWSATEDAPAAMVSASHNPFPDNGIKLFSAGGRKLPDDVEPRLEAELQRLLGAVVRATPPPHRRVRCRWRRGGPHRAGRRRRRSARGLRGRGRGVDRRPAPRRAERGGRLRQRIGVGGGAHGAARPGASTSTSSTTGPTAPTSTTAAARPTPTGSPGRSSSAAPTSAWRSTATPTGCCMVDAAGELVDGDQLIALCAVDRHERGTLPGDAVVVTVMTNLGFRLAMEAHGIAVVETAVGDRYVLEALEARGLALGGEQSGHLIFRDLATTGDGLLTAVQALDVVVRSGRPLAEVAGVMSRLPQVLRNVRVARRDPAVVEHLAADIAAVEGRLGELGRVLVRPSGTEPLVRVMAEAPTEAEAEAAVAELVRAVEAHAGG